MENAEKIPFPFLPRIDRRAIVPFQILLLLLMAGGVYFHQSGVEWCKYVIYLVVILNIFSYPLYANGKGKLTKDEQRWTMIGIAAVILLLFSALVLMLFSKL